MCSFRCSSSPLSWLELCVIYCCGLLHRTQV
uniref:Uncharacterized protein n=1 Tax=Arundo donax TaxID=35708 RepID=A0A0A8Y1R2_ARUDO